MSNYQQHKGIVIASFGKHLLVRSDQGEEFRCIAKGKKNQAAVGDRVSFNVATQQEAVVDKVIDRKNLLYRSDEMRSKQFAANVDQLIIVVATEPDFNQQLISRALTGAWSVGINALIVLNKIDLTERYSSALKQLHDFTQLDIPIIEVSTHSPEALQHQLLPLITHKTSLLLGQSGMGKSSILNVLVPTAQAFTQEISVALGTGKHTTTHTRLYTLPQHQHTHLIDSPGFQAFGLKHLSREEIERGFPEFMPYSSHCKFYNCSHRHEPGCQVLNALNEAKISNARHDLYCQLLQEHEQVSY